ncbi:hypothetical protein HanXRQr2_Chr09g0417631 [Helianthus annuus]|uniref:Uncharacterized protein n=1 Tax=Helianthus annuus TaxID=4232 RepID=A0A251U0R9_HELAN|nr:uncharacterized protein LOC110875149 [Helianthus annuus]KAF5793458.1 hypothetical protein HanXRQr2_Chr09g0417631 [Helianthus annuus]KAJ0528295.1 hypothetical protein HanHA300_Chr09g0343531 [Helianthus annuus]KAJ0544724.1 hypothetical protein HanHA89_Chr09g0364771 [Helianthus annuus]
MRDLTHWCVRSSDDPFDPDAVYGDAPTLFSIKSSMEVWTPSECPTTITPPKHHTPIGHHLNAQPLVISARNQGIIQGVAQVNLQRVRFKVQRVRDRVQRTRLQRDKFRVGVQRVRGRLPRVRVRRIRLQKMVVHKLVKIITSLVVF